MSGSDKFLASVLAFIVFVIIFFSGYCTHYTLVTKRMIAKTCDEIDERIPYEECADMVRTDLK